MRYFGVRTSFVERIHKAMFRTRMLIRFDLDAMRNYARQIGVEAGDGSCLYITDWGTEPWLIEIGRNTWVTSGVVFLTHDVAIMTIRNGPYGVMPGERLNRYGRIVVGANCSIGIRAIILPGVHIGDNSIVGAGAVVTRSVPAGSIVGGNPARVIGSTAEFARKAKAGSLDSPDDWRDLRTKRLALEHLVGAPPETPDRARTVGP